MKNHQYLINKLSRATILIAKKVNNDQEVTVSELAEAANISKFHFHRIYRLLLGETCQQTVTRLKLAKATQSLASSDASITVIAQEAGFSSSQALAKALKRELKSTATDLKNDHESLCSIQARLMSSSNQEYPSPYQLETVTLEPMALLQITTNDAYPELHQHYGQLFEAAEGINNILAILGFAHDDTHSHLEKLRFDCALLVKELPEGLADDIDVFTTQEQPYIVARHQGSYQQLDDTIDSLYAHCISNTDYSFSNLPSLHHYLDDPEEVQEELLRTDIYIPVQNTI